MQSESAGSLQQQIDELKTGQQKLLEEMGALRQLLREQQAQIQFLTRSAPATVFSLNVRGEPFRGESRAKVAIIEYSDFECPYCGKYQAEVYPQIEKEYIRTSKVKYYFRDLPAKEHSHSLLAAQAARCAGDQGHFWEMHDLLFVAQTALAESNVLAYAQVLGLDTVAFQGCLSSGGYTNAIQLSVESAQKMGVYGTPAFVVGTLSEDGDLVRVRKILIGADADTGLKPALEEILASPNFNHPPADLKQSAPASTQ